MTQIVVAQRMWQRRDTAANWSSVNPILAAGEIGVELGATSSDPQKFKIGNGATPWSLLAYGGGSGGGGTTWHTGAGAPASGLGVDGDLYLRTSNGDVYEKAGGSWSVVGNLAGPPGPAGPAGPAGASSGQITLGAGDRVNPLPVGAKALTPVSMACAITGAVVVLVTSDGLPGDLTLDVRRVSFADFGDGRPNTGDSILSASIIISGNYKSQQAASAFSDTALAENDVLLLYVVSRSPNITHMALSISTEKAT